MNYSEKRRHPRLSVFSAAMLVIGDDGFLSEVQDLSQGGVRVARPRNWQADAGIECHLFLIFDQDTIIGLRVKVVRSGSEDLGLEFAAGQEARIERLLYESRFLDSEVL
ncbi:MAG: PilZ domain-containing protein [Tahibacter sp.]